jgi:hypothetical protein
MINSDIALRILSIVAAGSAVVSIVSLTEPDADARAERERSSVAGETPA